MDIFEEFGKAGEQEIPAILDFRIASIHTVVSPVVGIHCYHRKM